jgi:hypothetical protein
MLSLEPLTCELLTAKRYISKHLADAAGITNAIAEGF